MKNLFRSLHKPTYQGDWPAVSCMCLTYGRNAELEEAIESFLRQDYPGVKQLLVLNDLAEQTLVFDHPEVDIVNLRERCPTVGDKRNECARLAKHDTLFVWDDDDIYLPNRLTLSVQRMQQQQLRFYKPDRGFHWNSGKIVNLVHNVFHSQSCFERSLFDEIGGYPSMGSGQDQAIEAKIAALGIEKFIKEPIDNYFYLYRWHGISLYHLSAFGLDEKSGSSGETKVALTTKVAIRQGLIPTGIVPLKPTWRFAYPRLTKRFRKGFVESS